MSRLRTVAIIPARGGSQGIPRKNLRPLGGKPLVLHSVDAALAAGRIDRVIVSTDDPELAELAVRHGAEAPFLRPKGLSGSRAMVGEAIAHALEHLEAEGWTPDAVATLYPTHPFRPPGLIDFLLAKLERGYSKVLTVRALPVGPLTFLARRDQGFGPLSAAPAPGQGPTACYRSYGLFTAELVQHDGLPEYFHTITDPAGLVDIDDPEDLLYAERLLADGLVSFHGAEARP